MTSLQVRTGREQHDTGADVLLDWFAERPASTVQYEPAFLKQLAPSPVARDLLRLGGAVYCADKIVPRGETTDFWTRDLALQVPISDVVAWDAAKPMLIGALSFLSGDHWEVQFVADAADAPPGQSMLGEFDAVSLFSGGMDSLAGVIDLLEDGRSLTLVGHHDSSLADHKQVELYEALRHHYGTDRVSLRRLLLRPTAPNRAQARQLPTGQGENSTRSRSFLFLAAGLVVADALGADVPLFIPENGFIGINVPLTPARVGSLSTRTTHPLFMHRMRLLLDQLGLGHPVVNPFRLMTKGELLEGSRNPDLLARLAPQSSSCSHPEANRWRKRAQGNCGYCYPCLIRRAAMHRIGQDRASDYAWDALTDAGLLRRNVKSGRSLLALTQSLGRPEHPDAVLHNGRIPNGETRAFFDVYSRGRAELRNWLSEGAGPELRRRLV